MDLKVVLFLFIGIFIGKVHPWAVNIYESENLSGLSIGVAGQEEECVPIPKYFLGKSIDTRDFCVNLFENDDCTGKKFSFWKGEGSASAIPKLTSNRLSSVKSCNTDY